MLRATFAAFVLAGLVVSSPSPSPSHTTSCLAAQPSLAVDELKTSPCDALVAAGLRDRLLFPNETAYATQIQTWWSANTRLHPWCLLLPYNAQEVSLALKTLVSTEQGAEDWHIAIKSGGHSSTTGSNNVANGVTIDLAMINGSHYDQATNTARVGSGGRWANVYASLQEQGVTVVGGRDGNVGVGGFLLGGGISYFTPKMGFACDSIVNYEVVLADGTIINTNRTYHSDLWKALKGGGSNFGIVTRFDLEAIPTRELFFELRYLTAGEGDTDKVVTEALVAYANHDESQGDDTMVTFWTHDTSVSNNTVVGVIHVNTAGDSSSVTSFDNVRALPAIYNVTAMQTMAQTAASSAIEAGSLNAGSTRFFKNDPVIIEYALAQFDEFVASVMEYIPAQNVTPMMFFQPFWSYVGKMGQQKGNENMLGLDEMKYNAMLWSGGVGISAELPDSGNLMRIAQAGVNELSAKIARFAESVDGGIDQLYMNYADGSQDPLGSYGQKQVEFLREVANKYDPEGVFQNRIPGGFKIGRVVS